MGVQPAAIVFVNPDLTSTTKDRLQLQLHINQTYTGEEFDALIAAHPTFPTLVKQLNIRVLVIRPFDDLTNRNLADVAIFIKNGMVSVEINKFGPPGATFLVEDCHYSQFGLF